MALTSARTPPTAIKEHQCTVLQHIHPTYGVNRCTDRVRVDLCKGGGWDGVGVGGGVSGAQRWD